MNKKRKLNLLIKKKPKIQTSTSVYKKKKKWWEIEFGKVVSESILLQTTRQLAALTAAGVPILETLELLVKSSKNKRIRETLEEISESIRNGNSLSEAIGDYPKIFPVYFSPIIKASEESGDLNTAFETLSEYIERDYLAKRTVKSALFYPAILIVVSIIAVFTLTIAVLPKFEIFFLSLNAKLPAPTRALLNLSSFIAKYWWIFPAVGIFITILIYLIRRTPTGRYKVDSFILKFPLAGKVIELIILERFTRVLGTLSNAGVPLINSLELAKITIRNNVFTKAIDDVIQGIIQGRGFVDPLADTKVFPNETVEILKIGEQSGRLTEQLNFASAFYSRDVDYKLKNIGNLIEPAILTIVGGGVGFVAVALVSAMYGIYSTQTFGG